MVLRGGDSVLGNILKGPNGAREDHLKIFETDTARITEVAQLPAVPQRHVVELWPYDVSVASEADYLKKLPVNDEIQRKFLRILPRRRVYAETFVPKGT